MSKEIFETQVDGSNHPVYRPLGVTIFIHDRAYPTVKTNILSLISGHEPKSEGIPVCRYDYISIEMANEMTNEQIGLLVRKSLEDVKRHKTKIEQ